MSDRTEITPVGSSAQIYLDTAPLPPVDSVDLADNSAELKLKAMQKLMDDFGFTETMARAVVGT
jgi:hypothetical protein